MGVVYKGCVNTLSLSSRSQPNDDGVWVEYDLYILHLPDVAVRPFDGECDEVVPLIASEPRQGCVASGAVTPFIQRVPCSRGCIRGFFWVIRVFQDAYEWVLSWVEIPLTHVTGGVAPQAMHCWCTDWRSASHAAIFALLLATALVNCSSLHIEHTFITTCCVRLGFPKRDW